MHDSLAERGLASVVGCFILFSADHMHLEALWNHQLFASCRDCFRIFQLEAFAIYRPTEQCNATHASAVLASLVSPTNTNRLPLFPKLSLLVLRLLLNPSC